MIKYTASEIAKDFIRTRNPDLYDGHYEQPNTFSRNFSYYNISDNYRLSLNFTTLEDEYCYYCDIYVRKTDSAPTDKIKTYVGNDIYSIAAIKKTVKKALKFIKKRDSVITISSEICSGKPVIQGTRLPVSMILSLLAAGSTIKDITKLYPWVTKKEIKKMLLEVAEEYDKKEGI